MEVQEKDRKWYPCVACGKGQVGWVGALCLKCMDKRVKDALSRLPKKLEEK